MKVCITGGTGTLGRALARRLVTSNLADRVVIMSRDEMKQADMSTESWVDDRVRFFLGDVRDTDRMIYAFHGCDTVVHAAALKRVDAIAYNPMEVRKTNIQGSANVLSAALASDICRVLMISSDKACEPTNAYGISKAAMEQEAIAFNSISVPRGMRVSCTRYGNVLGSRGSVVHVWRKAIAEGRRIPLTSTEATRFWLTIDDAVNVVLEALDQMEGGEIFVPNLLSMQMVDLVEAMAPEQGIILTGMRPGGEKLHETLITREEAPRTLLNGSLWVITPHMHSWRRDGWGGSYSRTEPMTSDSVPRLKVEEMKKMLEGV